LRISGSLGRPTVPLTGTIPKGNTFGHFEKAPSVSIAKCPSLTFSSIIFVKASVWHAAP
jgi:hypothetical protein